LTPGSKDVLLDWYPGTALEMEEATRARKTTKFGSSRYVYRPEVMKEIRAFFRSRDRARVAGAYSLLDVTAPPQALTRNS